jgi:aminomethyltransferase
MGFAGSDLLAPFEFRWFPFEDDEIFVARMGFTGDLGYEFWMKTELCDGFMQQIVSAREHMGIAIPGYGLSALEACRIEGGFVVAGWDFATEADPAPGFERNPFEVGLGWTVNLDAVEFVGRDALRQRKADGHQYLIRRFQTADEHTLVDGSPVFGRKDDLAVVVGSINCVSWSWGMEKTIGNVSLLTDYAKMDEYWVLLDGQPRTIELSRGPLIKLARRNQVPAPLGIAG